MLNLYRQVCAENGETVLVYRGTDCTEGSLTKRPRSAVLDTTALKYDHTERTRQESGPISNIDNVPK